MVFIGANPDHIGSGLEGGGVRSPPVDTCENKPEGGGRVSYCFATVTSDIYIDVETVSLFIMMLLVYAML